MSSIYSNQQKVLIDIITDNLLSVLLRTDKNKYPTNTFIYI